MNARVKAARGQAMRRMKHHPSNAGRTGRIGGGKTNLYGSGEVNLYETVAARPTLYLFIVLRHRTLSFTISLSKEAKQALRLIARIHFIQPREKRPSREGKSAFT